MESEGSEPRQPSTAVSGGDLIGNIPVYPITTEVAHRAGRIDAEQREQGVPIAAADLLIGVSALELGYAMGTANVRHFERIPGLAVQKL